MLLPFFAHGLGPAARPRVIIADDHKMIVAGFRSLLEREYEIAGVAHTGDGLLHLVSECSADCLLLDLLMPGRNGLELIPTIRKLRPEMRILVVTMLLDRVMAEAAFSAGASGFVAKDSGVEELRAALSAVLGGGMYMSPRVPKTSHRVGLTARHLGLHRLTPRQEEIVLLLGEGRSEAEVARLLGLRQSTITFHKHNLMRVLGIVTDSALTQYAVLVRAGIEAAQPPGST